LIRLYVEEKMMPYYDYFAAGVQACRELESFSISNYFLPPSPWLGNSILPVLSVNRGLETLELSNCSLSNDDFLALSNWIAGNSTLSLVNFSRNNIESVDAIKSLAKAIRKHPSIRHVNLAYCSLGNGNIQALNKILSSCDSCHSLEIGHEDFPSNCVAAVVEFIGNNKSLKSFSLTGATVDKGNRKKINDSLSRNKSIQSFKLRSNKLQLPSIIRNSRKITKALSRLTQLDMSSNKLSVQGAKMLAAFIEKPECNLVTLILSNNHLTTKGANALLPAVKKNSTLKVLDLSCNWLSDALAPVLVDLLKGNVKLCDLDLTGNKSLRTHQRVRSTRRRWGFDLVEAGCGKIVNEALFDTTSLEALLDSNHTCIVKMKNGNRGDLYEDTIRKVRRGTNILYLLCFLHLILLFPLLQQQINSLQVSESKKIQYKLILSRTVGEKKNLLDHHMLDELPLELLQM
jgi:Ran GTPase-activating protein (RanGAP) involved in mRNA processing and transport